MNARLETPSLGVALSGLWDQEAERAILGSAMLDYPMPAWLEPRHFFPTQHQRIYDAVQSVGGNVAHVNAWLRDSADKWSPPIASAIELAKMCDEAMLVQRMGWALDFETVRELANQRALVDTMQRLTIELRHGNLTHRECRKRLSEHFKEAG